MGYLNSRHGITFLDNTPPGKCPECATAHGPEQPHNQQSLAYQYKFYDRHGRWPTWSDAMAHCADEVKQFWTEALKKHGVNVNNNNSKEVK